MIFAECFSIFHFAMLSPRHLAELVCASSCSASFSTCELRARWIFRRRLKATILWLPRRLFVLHTLPGTHEKSRPSLNGSLLDMFGRLWFVHVCSHTAQVQFMK